MSVLEIVLLVLNGVLAVLLVVTVSLLGVSRRRVAGLRKKLDRPSSRLVPTPGEAVRSVVGTAIKVKDQGFGGAWRSSIGDLARWADVERPDLASLANRDGTVTILFSDIEGSTALNHELGDRGWVQLLAKHDRLVSKAVQAHHGHVIKKQGDGFMVAFAEAEQAVAAACEVQRRIAGARSGSRLGGVAVRIGAHKGSAVHRDGDLFGRNVAYAARVADQAEGGEVLISTATLEALPEDSAPVLETRSVDLKGIPETQHLHLVDWQD